MKVLADTHTLVWALSSPETLSARARKLLEESEVIVSVASLWELLLKKDRPDALLTDPLRWWQEYVDGPDIAVLGIRHSHVMQIGRLPEIHRDPFDRILVAQAAIERMTIVSKDQLLARYGVRVVW